MRAYGAVGIIFKVGDDVWAFIVFMLIFSQYNKVYIIPMYTAIILSSCGFSFPP